MRGKKYFDANIVRTTRNEEKKSTAVREAKPIGLLEVRGRLVQLLNRKTPARQVVKMVRADRRA